jgi:hypothetical protein
MRYEAEANIRVRSHRPDCGLEPSHTHRQWLNLQGSPNSILAALTLNACNHACGVSFGQVRGTAGHGQKVGRDQKAGRGRSKTSHTPAI